jgi:hypothetical protein
MSPPDFQRLAQHGQGLQSSLQAGNYLSAWPQLMEARRTVDAYPGLAGQLRPHLGRISGNALGGWEPYLWDASGMANQYFGSPERFAQSFGALAPGVMKAVGGVGGLPGLLALQGFLGGDTRTLDDLKTLTPGLWKGAAAGDVIDQTLRRLAGR